MLTFVEEVTIARLVELELAGFISQPKVVGIADGCLGARAGLQDTPAWQVGHLARQAFASATGDVVSVR